MDMNLEALGFTKEELQDRVVSKIANTLLLVDEDDEMFDTDFAREIQARVKTTLDEHVAAIFDSEVLPKIRWNMNNLVLQETNRWGEKQGEPVTFIEYLIQRAESYLYEKVDYDGKSQAEKNGFSWSGKQTRLTHLVHDHLHYEIKNAMENAVLTVQKAITPAIEKTVKIKLAEISETLKVEVKTGR